MFGVRRKGTISGLARLRPLSNRQSKSQLMFSALLVSIRIFSVCRSPSPEGEDEGEVKDDAEGGK